MPPPSFVGPVSGYTFPADLWPSLPGNMESPYPDEKFWCKNAQEYTMIALFEW